MDDVGMRVGQPADAAAIRRLTREAYAKWVPLIGREPLPMAADYEAALLQHRFDLLFAGGALAALIETVRHPDHLFIVNVAVAPAHQGRGHGRRLLAHAEQLAAPRGTIRLTTNARFEANLALYRRLGYAVDGEEPFINGTAIHMSKRLGQSIGPHQGRGAPITRHFGRSASEAPEPASTGADRMITPAPGSPDGASD